MRKVFVFVLLLFTQNFCWALDDACTKPKEYTVDKRCYVTDAQKKEKPYNAVVGLVDKNGVYCTGTIVSTGNELYLYTAKHCTDHNGNGDSDYSLTIKTQDGKRYVVYKDTVGTYSIPTDKKQYSDWAVYKIKQTGLQSVNLAQKPSELFPENFVLSIGYGGLKVMSDHEIKKFKENYIEWLISKGATRENIEKHPKLYGFKNGGVNGLDDIVEHYINGLDYSYRKYIFGDENKLKVSRCRYKFYDNEYVGCQVWGGNSGGGIFDFYGDLMAITTRGNNDIGGNTHANATYGINVVQQNLKETRRRK